VNNHGAVGRRSQQLESMAFRQATVVAALPEISRERLWQKIESGDDFVLVDALAPMSFAHSHLPGAVNLPPEWVDERGPRRIPDPESEIVVYCASSTCDSSVQVGTRLVELGYRNVQHYVGGKKDWVSAGLPLEGGGV
jgi:rhodanese-related sulfurtransferase